MASTQPYLEIRDLTKSVGERVLFRDISFCISERQRVGLVARNGTGKSTLLSIIAGTEGYDSGRIAVRKDLRIGYLEQRPRIVAGQSVLEACLGDGNDPERLLRARQVLTRLDITDLDRPMGELSGGQQRRVALAAVLITEPDMLILDEPTNHLDLGMIEWLEGFLSKGGKTILMVTHDRFFLDRVCTTILEIDGEALYAYRGNYAYYLEKREERLESARAGIARVASTYRRELEWMRSTPQARSHKSKTREEAFHELERKARQRIEERQVRLKSSGLYIGSKIFECHGLSKSFAPGTTILRDFSYVFARYEKMGIVGGNGTGKTTFIKMLLGILEPDSGSIDIGTTVRFGYFSQEGMAIDEGKRVMDVVTDIADWIDLGGGRRLTARQLLQHFLFSQAQLGDHVAKLSGGERRKLQLCTVLMRNPNFLVLDEPTNDLDIQTLQVFEEYLADFPGCVIVVSHDRFFMDKVVDHLLVFKGDGVVSDFPGNYTQYRQWQSLEDREGDRRDAPAKVARTRERPRQERPRLTYRQKQELEQLERDIQALEEERAGIEESLCGGSLPIGEIEERSRRLPILMRELDSKETRWLELSEIEGA